MKRILIVFLILLAYSNLKAEEEYYFNRFKYDKFVEWMHSVKVPGFILSRTQVQGSEETYNLEYMADFSNDYYELLTIRIGHPNVFYGYEELKTYEIAGPYDLEGFVAVFIYHKTITKPSNLTYLLVQMPEIQATFSITALTKERLTKEIMEEYFKKFNLNLIDNVKSIKWPDEIPIAFRLPAELVELSKDKIKEEFAKNVIEIKISKSDEFLRGLRRFYKEKKGWLDLTTFNNITLICKTAQDINVLDNMKDGELIEFVYYIK
ncbi:MAG: hypothetical protein V1779_04040 [bacterium]